MTYFLCHKLILISFAVTATAVVVIVIFLHCFLAEFVLPWFLKIDYNFHKTSKNENFWTFFVKFFEDGWFFLLASFFLSFQKFWYPLPFSLNKILSDELNHLTFQFWVRFNITSRTHSALKWCLSEIFMSNFNVTMCGRYYAFFRNCTTIIFSIVYASSFSTHKVSTWNGQN